jgi:hypothetical protein
MVHILKRELTIQLRLTNDLSTNLGTTCTVSAEPIDFISTTEPSVTFYTNTADNYAAQHHFVTFTPTQCFKYLLVGTHPDMSSYSAGYNYLRRIKITESESFEVRGTSVMCSSETYTLYRGNTPYSGNVTWVVTNVQPTTGSIVSEQRTGNTITLNKLTNGRINLKAVFDNPCGGVSEELKDIQVGVPEAPEFIEVYGNGATDPTCLYPGGYRAEAFGSGLATQFQWRLPEEWSSEVSGGNNPFIVGSNGFDIPLQVNPIYDYPAYMWVRSGNACGFGDLVYLEVGTNCDGYRLSPYTISPNPTTTNVTIDGSKSKKLIKQVQLIDKSGNIRKTMKYKGEMKINFDVSGLTPNLYYLKIFDGQKWVTIALQVQ